MNDVAELLDRLTGDRAALLRRQAQADRVVAATSAGHLVHELHTGGNRPGRKPWRVDPVPLLLDADTFDRLADEIRNRVAALELILRDLYGPRRLVADGVVPGEALSASVRYRMGTVGAPSPPRWLTTYAVDLVELADGNWRIVQDYTDLPTGIGYALLDRTAMLPVIEEVLDPADGDDVIASLAGVAGELRHALVSTARVPSPRIVLFSGGGDSAGYVEHSQLAGLLGFTLVERPDLVVRQGRLWLRTLGGLDPIDVVYRRVEDADSDPIELSAPGGGGVPGLISAVTGGGVVLANAHGAGLIEDLSLAPTWHDAAEALIGSALRLPHLGSTSPADRFALRPAFRAGDLGLAPVVVRLHAIAGPDGVTVLPGGNGRVLADGDDPRQPSARTVKDVWVLDPRSSLRPVVAPLPQVDLASSVPTRAADALFWAMRAAERAEMIAKLIRQITVRRRQDPMLVTLDEGRWARRMTSLVRSVCETAAAGADDLARGPIVVLNAELAVAGRALGGRLRRFLAEAATVGEFLPGSTARELNTLAQLSESFGDARPPAEIIDDVLAALAAFAGTWSESTVRGPAWRFGEIGLRIERSIVLLGLVSSCVDGLDGGLRGPRRRRRRLPASADPVDSATLEVLLAVNESLVAYRRQYRSDVELAPALDLLLRDGDNPRGYLACVQRLAEHVADIGWERGVADVRQLESLSESPTAAASAVRALADEVVDTWFATPVKPTLVTGARPGRGP